MKVDKTKWERVRIVDVAPIQQYGGCVKMEQGKVWSLTLEHIESNTGRVIGKDYVCPNELGSSVIKFSTDNVLWSKLRPYLNKVVVPMQSGYASSELIPLLPNPSLLSKLFLAYFLKSPTFVEEMNSSAGGTRMPRASMKVFRDSFIPLPSLPEQRAIAAELDALQSVIDKLQEQLNDYDKLAQSIFHEMFGDVVNNDMGWETKQLQDIGSLKNGLNYDKNEKGYSIRIVGVGDFKDLRRIDDISTLSSISLMQKLSEDYLLKDGDIVFVRSNGNKNLVGRSVEVYPHNENVTFSGFCIRFRKEEDCVTNKYLIYLLTEEEYKKHYILKSNGIGIKSINQKILGQALIPLPTLPLQRQFAERVEAIEAQKALVRQQIADARQLFDSRMQYYFE